jgi:Immunity protein 26
VKTPPTYFRVLKRTRRKPEGGDIFVYQLDPFPDRYFFGRVIATDTTLGMFSQVVLIYLYCTTSIKKTDTPPLGVDDLMMPPIGTNGCAWTTGYFEVVRSGPNATVDVLPQHCFRDSRGWFYDEYSRRLPGPVEPVGIYGLAGIGSIDRYISQALGLPLKTIIPTAKDRQLAADAKRSRGKGSRGKESGLAT